MKKYVFLLAFLLPWLLSAQEDKIINIDPGGWGGIINLDPGGSLDVLLDSVQNWIWVSKDNQTGTETGTMIYPYNTIQEGLDAASDGNVVIVLEPVAGGSYDEHLVMSTANVRLMTLEGQTVEVELQSVGAIGLDIDANGVIIGGGSGMGFTFSCDAGLMIVFDADRSDVEISHNTIVVDDGGTIGINVGASGSTRLKVLNNLFVVSSGTGAFFAVKTLKDAEIIGNEFQGADSTSGYAIQISGFLDGIIADNYIHKGATIAGGFASGIFPHTNTTDPHVSDSLEIYNNIVQNCSNGIRLGHSNGADMKEIYVYNNILQHNSRGIFVHNDAQVFPATYDIYSNVFSDNIADISNTHATALNTNANELDDQMVFGDGTGAAAAPSLAFSDGNTGFYENPDNTLNVSVDGVIRYNFASTGFRSSATNGAQIDATAPTATVPGHTYNGDINTGLGRAGDDALSYIAGGVEAIRSREIGGTILTTMTDTVAADVILATGTISGNTGITLDTDPTIVLADTDCRNQARFNNDADVIDYTLPGAAVGLVVMFYDIGGGVITVDPVDGTDTIYLNGTSIGAGDAIDSPGAVGDFICLMAIDATRWVTVGRSGVWVDGGVD